MKLGSDPEFLIANSNGRVVPFNMLDGHTYKADTCTFFEDNVLVEGNHEPASTKQEWISSILSLKSDIQKFLHTYELELSTKVTHEFNDAQLDGSPKGRTFFCNPDYNVYTGKENDRPSPNGNLRSAGGHVHIATTIHSDLVVMACDVALGVPSILMDIDGAQRRAIYGKAGSFRPKPYGVEYRVLSNFWCNSEEYIGWVWDTVEHVLNHIEYYVGLHSKYDIRSIIDDSNMELAKEVVNELNIFRNR